MIAAPSLEPGADPRQGRFAPASLAAREIAIFAFDHASVKAIFAGHPLQRCVRDLFTGLKHASFSPTHLTRAGRAIFGLEAQRVRLG